MVAKPKLLVLQGERNFEISTYAESEEVREVFNVVKSSEIGAHNPDLVYCQAYGAVINELQNWHGPLAVHLGGNPWLELKGKRLQRAVELIRSANVVTCVSNFLAATIRRAMKTENIVALPGGLWGTDHTPIGVQPQRFEPKENYDIVNNQPRVIMGINLRNNPITQHKWIGIPKFLTAVKGVARRYNVEFVCCGKIDEDFPHMETWGRLFGLKVVRSHQLDDDGDRWPGLLRNSDIFVHPGHYDCWPRVVADAMCAGLPCLVCDTTGNVEPGRSERYGKDDKGVGTQLEVYLTDKAIREADGRRARASAEVLTDEHRSQFVPILRKALG